MDEAFRMSLVGGMQNDPALCDNGGRREVMMDHSRGEKTQSGMEMLLVVPGEEILGERP
jgi:hypothetical protein